MAFGFSFISKFARRTVLSGVVEAVALALTLRRNLSTVFSQGSKNSLGLFSHGRRGTGMACSANRNQNHAANTLLAIRTLAMHLRFLDLANTASPNALEGLWSGIPLHGNVSEGDQIHLRRTYAENELDVENEWGIYIVTEDDQNLPNATNWDEDLFQDVDRVGRSRWR